MLHKVAFILSVIVASLCFLCLIFPEWIQLTVYYESVGALKPMTAGVFYSCFIGNGSLRWVDCGRGRYHDIPWYALIQALYTIVVILTVISVPVHYKTMSSGKGRAILYRAAPTCLAFVGLGTQVVVLGLYGDHYDSQRWCILRYPHAQRTICTDVFNYPGETVALGWTYWIAVVTAFFAAANTLIDYAILNDEVVLQ